ncbi:hypothetical protein FOMG_19061 [Fusarium oxysporum f. sp. melonis 26406]|uniref:Secreted protein n=1 Tax=Fusarium oxysporum f. sp. melonis 26406 TaxID=1089452 RepID=W9YXC1_FUSOX|nr:hypothetical protein FOMG_19061 [Fusarium oxysporum f. sp. melonis 26406]
MCSFKTALMRLLISRSFLRVFALGLNKGGMGSSGGLMLSLGRRIGMLARSMSAMSYQDLRSLTMGATSRNFQERSSTCPATLPNGSAPELISPSHLHSSDRLFSILSERPWRLQQKTTNHSLVSGRF